MGNSPSSTGLFPDVMNASQELFQPYLSYTPKYDDRMEIPDLLANPYNWMGCMTVQADNGERYSATGFKIKLGLPTVQHQVILTSGHAVFFNGSYAKGVSIKFPDKASPIIVPKKNLWAPDEFTKNNNLEYNYGVMLVPSNTEDGFHWTTLMSEDEFHGRPVSCCGYSTDKGQDSLWLIGGSIDRIRNKTMGYMFESKEMTSGSPVYTLHQGSWGALGIQSHIQGNVFTAIRINTDMMRSILRHAGFPLQCSLKSKEYLDSYLCTNSTLGTATISCQTMKEKVEPNAVFEMIPLSSYKKLESVAISPLLFPNMYLTLTKPRGTNPILNKVKLDSDIFEMSLKERNEDGTLVSIESVAQPGLYMSIKKRVPVGDAWSNRLSSSNGHGKIATCSLVPKKQEIGASEVFVVSISQYIK